MSDFGGGSREKTIVFGIVAVLVVALVFLGFQLLPGSDDGPASEPGTAAPEALGAGGGSVDDVMSLLPYSEAELATGAEVARDFMAAYHEVVPDESAQERLDRLSPMLSEEFFGTVENLVLTTPNSAVDRDPQRTSTSAEVTGIRNIGAGSVIYEVRVRFLTDTGDDGGNDPVSYAVTTVPEDGGWTVYAFQDAAIGNDGEAA
ncbi:hypothetical protein BJF83_17135 [Nocardiopsis sp. CNR-923]|uniref:hypothetical protein n=1 Tax=Nocardiopsis sp. CNR-923 TaxID=1904965 RepID=UPI00095BDDD9|nr:hypothetical protein [Nocardiopsis sp. CNR-923]OLT27817.1 hypothetical protein BJF83_17135 [Nocardiopsis sp. CNR-923]